MATAYSTLKTQTDDQRRDITTTFISDAEVMRYFDAGNRMLQGENDWDFTQVSASISYVNGSTAYALSAIGNNDFKSPINLFYTYNYKFTFVSPEDFDALSAFNYNLYAIDGDFLKVKTTFGTATLSFDYYSKFLVQTSGASRQESFSATTDESLVPTYYTDILVDYVLMQINAKEGKYDDYKLRQDRLQNRLMQMKNDYKSKAARMERRMVNPRTTQQAVYDPKEFV